MVTMNSTVIRSCRECGLDFEITPEEQVFLADIGRSQGRPFDLPSRCVPCRRFRRQQKYGVPPPVMPGADVMITCRDCHTPFTFTRGEQEFFAQRDFSAPTRCRPCRQARGASARGVS